MMNNQNVRTVQRLKTGILLTVSIGLLALPCSLMAGPRRGLSTRTTVDAGSSPQANVLEEISRQLSQISVEVTPAVVHIQSRRDSRSGDVIEETGSGVLMTSPRYRGVFVVTNRHVVIGASLDQIDIHLSDGRILHPQRVLQDMYTDLAVLPVKASDLTTAHWGDSENLDIGHIVLAMGSPFGLSQSVTMGIISAKGRRSLNLGGPREVINQDFLQTDAAINPGNSGGPLMDLHGRVVGINTAIASQGGGNEGIGFSIPSNLVRYVVEELLEDGRVERGYLGVKLDSNFTLQTAKKLSLDRLRGARVIHVYRDTPAYLAGLQVDDVILNFDGIDIQDESHLIHRVSLTPVNKSVRIIVLRGGREITLHVTLIERPSDPRTDGENAVPPPARRFFPGSFRHERTGLQVHRFDQGLAVQLGMDPHGKGVIVMQTPKAGGKGDDTLQLYDVIEEVARRPISSIDDFDQALADHPGPAPLLMKVRRKVGAKTIHRLILWQR